MNVTPLIGMPNTAYLVLRPFQIADAEMLFHWKNDPVTRANSGHTDVVPWEVHRNWFYGILLDPKGKILRIAEIYGMPVGFVRTAAHDDGRTEVHYTVSPVFRGMGVGKTMVKKFVDHLIATSFIPGVSGLVLPIKQGNERSEKIAASLGLIAHMHTAIIVTEGEPPIIEWAEAEASDA